MQIMRPTITEHKMPNKATFKPGGKSDGFQGHSGAADRGDKEGRGAKLKWKRQH